MTTVIDPGKDIITAIRAIDADANCAVKNEDLDDIEWVSSEISKSDIEAKMTELSTAYDALAYARTRKLEYPSLAEQLDLLYKDMLADKGDKTGDWFAAVKKVKDDNPK
tara:strand:+ start:792 stop:1118 length:327 start_codon:yes stop_codon:yes gene_type:complete